MNSGNNSSNGKEKTPFASNFIQIMPKEGKSMIRDIDLRVAKMSITLKTMIECTTSVNEANPVHLSEISSVILDKTLEYLQYHFDDPIEDKDSDDEDYNDIKRSDDISEWDRKFMKDIEKDALFELIQAANYLNIKGLLELCCKVAANQIRGKSAEEVQEMWNIKCDLTEEEVEQLKKENAWAED